MPPLPHATDALSRGATYAPPARINRSLRIGIAHPAFGAVGGAEVLLSRYVEFLHSRGHQVRIVTKRFDAAEWPTLVSRAELCELPNSWKDHLGVPGRHPEVARRCARHAQALEDCDVIIAGNHPSNITAAFVADGARSLWTCMEPSRRLYPTATMPNLTDRVLRTDPLYDTTVMRSLRGAIERDLAGGRNDAAATQRAMDRSLVPHLARVCAISEFTAANIHRIYNRRVDGIICPTIMPVDPPDRCAGIAGEGLRVLVHGRMDLLKNVETVIRGFHQFTKRHPGKHELHLVGEGPDLLRLLGVTRHLEIAHAVRVHGFLGATALEEVYARCDVMAALPLDEPFGMVFPEAAMRGLLLVGPNHGGPMEILEGGRYGWAVDAFSPEPVMGAFEEIWRLPIHAVERRRLSAYEAMVERYAPEATLPAVEQHVLALAPVTAQRYG